MNSAFCFISHFSCHLGEWFVDFRSCLPINLNVIWGDNSHLSLLVGVALCVRNFLSHSIYWLGMHTDYTCMICRRYELLVMGSSLNFNSAYYGIVTNSSYNWKSKIKFSSCIFILLWVGPSSAKCLPYTLKVFISINVRHFFYLRKLILKVANLTKFLYNVIIEINPSS